MNIIGWDTISGWGILEGWDNIYNCWVKGWGIWIKEVVLGITIGIWGIKRLSVLTFFNGTILVVTNFGFFVIVKTCLYPVAVWAEGATTIG